MQSRSDPITKIANDRSFMSESASNPSTSRARIGPAVGFGGVCGSARQ